MLQHEEAPDQSYASRGETAVFGTGVVVALGGFINLLSGVVLKSPAAVDTGLFAMITGGGTATLTSGSGGTAERPAAELPEVAID